MNQFFSLVAVTCKIQNLCVVMFLIVNCRIGKAFSSKKKAEGRWETANEEDPGFSTVFQGLVSS